ncbi:MAG: tripartite tricarboxylate transporter TctB family protein [Pseudorhodobacter sp.]
MKTSEMIFLGGLAAFAIATLIPSINMPYSSGQTFGPGFVPLNMSVAVLILCALLVLRQFRTHKAITSGGTEGASGEGVIAVIVAIALIAATVFAAHYGSLLLPLGLCSLAVTRFLLGRSWLVAIGSTLATIAVIYAIFSLWLQIPLR